MKKGPKSSILRKIAFNLPKHLSRYLLTYTSRFLDLRAPPLTGFQLPRLKSARKPQLIPKGR